ncbi:MAG: low molecular weight phosphatase family protein [Rhodobacteraceae bacterium]|nr:low molecular weight phosphatase family protein [Paracoccaceae bacterium]
MATSNPTSVLFCCDHNSIRSPMAEGLLKQHVGTKIFVQSAGVKGDMDIDGFTIAVCREVGVELSRHRVRTFDDMMQWGDDLDSYDLIVALSPASQRRALEYTRFHALEVEYWPTMDPSGFGDDREAKMERYRQLREQLSARIKARFPQ